MLEVVSDRMDHAHLVLEARDVVKVGELPDILQVSLWHAQGDLPFLSNHGISA